MKKTLVLIATLMTSATAFAEDIKICVEGAYPPFSETAEDGSVIGFDIDIANALCGELGANCEMVKTDWDGIIPALTSKKCDAIIASMSDTEERREVVAFSGKYYTTPNYFVGAEGADLAAALEGTVGVQRGTIHQDYMEGAHPDTELALYGTQDEAVLDLQAGRVDAVVGDGLQLIEGFIQTEGGAGFEVISDDVTDVEYHGAGSAIAVRQGEEALADRFTAAISAIRDSGAYKEINDKYFPVDIFGAE